MDTISELIFFKINKLLIKSCGLSFFEKFRKKSIFESIFQENLMHMEDEIDTTS